MPLATVQQDQIKRYWNPMCSIHVAQLLPGQVCVTTEHEMISTVLGSCVAACICDPINKVGGMNHFRLPGGKDANTLSQDPNYGIYSMELLINEILKKGGVKKNFVCQVFGGGNVVPGIAADIGAKNVKFVIEFLRQEKILVTRQDVGHESAQQVYFHPLTNLAFSVLKTEMAPEMINHAEQNYMKDIDKQMTQNTITYF